MNKRVLVAFAALASIFSLTIVGASVLNLTDSDPAPAAGATEASCAGTLAVTNPVKNEGALANKIVNIYVNGDMTQCEGQTIRLEATLASGAKAYAFRVIGSAVTSLTFTFNETTGDFRDTVPTVSSGALVNAGVRVAPPRARDFNAVDLVIARTFE